MFWHRHSGCQYATMPKSNIEYWIKKFKNNIHRDKLVYNTLCESHIKCLIIWECTVRNMKKDKEYSLSIIQKVESFLHNSDMFLEL